jgi:hypothetical protein
VWTKWAPNAQLPGNWQEQNCWRKGFLEQRIKADNDSPVHNQEIIIDTPILDEVQLPVRPVKAGKQLVVNIMAEAIKMKKRTDLPTLLNSGYTCTCIDEESARAQGWPLKKIAHTILIKYTDGTMTERSKI